MNALETRWRIQCRFGIYSFVPLCTLKNEAAFDRFFDKVNETFRRQTESVRGRSRNFTKRRMNYIFFFFFFFWIISTQLLCVMTRISLSPRDWTLFCVCDDHRRNFNKITRVRSADEIPIPDQEKRSHSLFPFLCSTIVRRRFNNWFWQYFRPPISSLFLKLIEFLCNLRSHCLRSISRF